MKKNKRILDISVFGEGFSLSKHAQVHPCSSENISYILRFAQRETFSKFPIVSVILFIFILFTFVLSGCATTTDQAEGPVVTAKPVIKPGLSTTSINTTMTESDRTKLQQAVEVSKNNQHVTWQNDTTHIKYDFVSTDIFVNDKGQPCRHYTLTQSTSGFLHDNDQQVKITACRMDDMKWRIVPDESAAGQ